MGSKKGGSRNVHSSARRFGRRLLIAGLRVSIGAIQCARAFSFYILYSIFNLLFTLVVPRRPFFLEFDFNIIKTSELVDEDISLLHEFQNRQKTDNDRLMFGRFFANI